MLGNGRKSRRRDLCWKGAVGRREKRREGREGLPRDDLWGYLFRYEAGHGGQVRVKKTADLLVQSPSAAVQGWACCLFRGSDWPDAPSLPAGPKTEAGSVRQLVNRSPQSKSPKKSPAVALLSSRQRRIAVRQWSIFRRDCLEPFLGRDPVSPPSHALLLQPPAAHPQDPQALHLTGQCASGVVSAHKYFGHKYRHLAARPAIHRNRASRPANSHPVSPLCGCQSASKRAY